MCCPGGFVLSSVVSVATPVRDFHGPRRRCEGSDHHLCVLYAELVGGWRDTLAFGFVMVLVSCGGRLCCRYPSKLWLFWEDGSEILVGGRFSSVWPWWRAFCRLSWLSLSCAGRGRMCCAGGGSIRLVSCLPLSELSGGRRSSGCGCAGFLRWVVVVSCGVLVVAVGGRYGRDVLVVVAGSVSAHERASSS